MAALQFVYNYLSGWAVGWEGAGGVDGFSLRCAGCRWQLGLSLKPQHRHLHSHIKCNTAD